MKTKDEVFRGKGLTMIFEKNRFYVRYVFQTAVTEKNIEKERRLTRYLPRPQ